MKHSEGQWKATEKGIRTNRGFLFFFPSWPHRYPDQEKRYEEELEEKAANIRLVCAAPALLAILKKIESAGGWYGSALEFDHDQDGETLHQEVKDAIAKAEGKQ